MTIGCKVTLRRERMYEFLDRLITIALPRVRDFRGAVGKSFDGRGNYAMGLKEQIVFPEIDYDKVDQVRGMDIVICTTAKTDEEAKALLKGFDMPVRELKRRGERRHGQDERHREEQAARAAGEAVRRPSARALKAIARRRACRWRSASRRASSWPSCRATPRRRASATAAS